MAAPASLKNAANQSVPTLVTSGGQLRYPLGVGDVADGFDADAAWEGVATHGDADTFNAGDGVVVIGGVYAGNAKHFVVDSLGRLAVIFAPATGATTDAGGTVAVGGTAQDALATNASRVYLLVQNLDDAEDLWVDLGQDAVVGSSIRLAAGASFVMEGNYVSSDRLSVIAATTNHPFACKEA